MRKKEKIKLLEFEIIDLTMKLATLKDEREFMINYTNKLEKSLKSMSNKVRECNKEISELKTKNHLLKRDILSQGQLLEIKESIMVNIDNKNKKLEEEKASLNELVMNLNKENRQLKNLVKTNKDARTYLKGKSERE